MKVLVVDDEKDVTDFLEYNLKDAGYEVIVAWDGQEALKKAEMYLPDIVLLDIMMPEVDGVEVCRRLRANPTFSNTFILILTARTEEYSEIAGFDAGADDYIIKPFRVRSLIKRLQALKRRQLSEDENIEFDGFKIDKDRFVIVKEGKNIQLPKKEFELLYLLASNPNKVITRDRILEQVWGKNIIVGDRTIDVHIRRIRKKIGEELIQTVKGVGYKFIDH